MLTYRKFHFRSYSVLTVFLNLFVDFHNEPSSLGTRDAGVGQGVSSALKRFDSYLVVQPIAPFLYVLTGSFCSRLRCTLETTSP
jgi:hypothetical protein